LKRRFFARRATELQPSAGQELPFVPGKIGLNDMKFMMMKALADRL
jgi:hypothetical protein